MEEKKFSRYPQKVKKGILLLFSSWAFFILSQAVLYGTVSLLHITFGMLCCVMVYAIHGWGRIVCIIYNIILIAAGLYTLHDRAGSEMLYSLPSAANLVQVILFSLTTYYLLNHETSSFYKKTGKERLSTDAP